MKRYRPKTAISYSYSHGMIFSAFIWCYPQSRWTLLSETVYSVRLQNKNVTIEIQNDDFKKHWVEVEE